MLRDLTELSSVCMSPRPQQQDVEAATALVQRVLAAEDAYILCAGDPHFTRLCCEDDPSTYEIKQRGYYIVWERLATNADVPAGLFDVHDRIVEGGAIPQPGKPCTHLASILPGDESNSELLIVRGPWPQGLSQEQIDFVVSARPMLSILTCNVLDADRRARQREQLTALADVAKAFNEAKALDKVLTSVATALAKASGFDWTLISVYDEDTDTVTDEAINLARHSGTRIAAMARGGNLSADLREEIASAPGTGNAQVVGHLARLDVPVLISDVMSDELERQHALKDYHASFPMLREFYKRAHIISTAVFPIRFQGRALGVVWFSSSTKRSFDTEEVDLLSALASQAATTIQGLRLYRDLERSREDLRRYAERLEETNRVEHFLARTDALTGLPNRRHIEETLDAECARAGRYRQPMSIAVADLDHFKQINDGYGHQTGDDALRFVASVARQAMRTADFVGRWGGDEFVFILPSTDAAQARRFAERFRRALAQQPFSHPKLAEPQTIRVSLGVAQAGPATYEHGHLLFEQADRALYAAKEGGRDRTVLAPAEDAQAA